MKSSIKAEAIRRKKLKREYKYIQRIKQEIASLGKTTSLKDLNNLFKDIYTVFVCFTAKERIEYNLIKRYENKLDLKHLNRKTELYNIAKERSKSEDSPLSRLIKEKSLISKIPKLKGNNYVQPVVIGKSKTYKP
jgi:hypothetical protein